MPLEHHILLSMSLYQLETESKHHCVFLAKCMLIKAVTTILVWYRSTCDGLSAALIPSPLGRRYNHYYTSAGTLKSAKPQKLLFQGYIPKCFALLQGKQKWWTPQTHAKQSKVSKQQSKISIQNLMEIFSNFFNISSLFSSGFSIYSLTNLVLMVLPTVSQSVFKSRPLPLFRC